MAKVKISKKARMRFLILTMAVLVVVIYLSYSLSTYWSKIVENKKETELLTAEYDKLLAEEKSLKSELNKLQDEDYVISYASEKFLYSKDGLTIIRILD